MKWLHFFWPSKNATEPVTDNVFAQADEDPFPEPIELEITDVIDLHSIPPKQIKAVIEEYLFQAQQRGFPFVRIIHGKGIGVQRETTRKVLAMTPFVKSYSDAPPDAGGWGATIVELLILDCKLRNQNEKFSDSAKE